MNEHVVVTKLVHVHPTAPHVQVAQIRKLTSSKHLAAEEGQTVTRALPGTLQTTQQLVVMLRTQLPAVTHVIHVHTDFGSTTAVETRTRVHVTATLILVARAVMHAIAADKHRQAVVFGSTPEVCLRTHHISGFAVRLQRSYVYVSCLLKFYNNGQESRGLFMYLQSRTTVFVGPIQTLLLVVTECRSQDTLKPYFLV